MDSLGEQYARENGIELKQFPANGEDFSEPCIHRSTSMASETSLSQTFPDMSIKTYGQLEFNL